MKPEEPRFNKGRHNILKIPGLSSAAIRSRNLGTGKRIELVYIPEYFIKNNSKVV
jgi:hypothetical protein